MARALLCLAVISVAIALIAATPALLPCVLGAGLCCLALTPGTGSRLALALASTGLVLLVAGALSLDRGAGEGAPVLEAPPAGAPARQAL